MKQKKMETLKSLTENQHFRILIENHELQYLFLVVTNEKNQREYSNKVQEIASKIEEAEIKSTDSNINFYQEVDDWYGSISHGPFKYICFDAFSIGDSSIRLEEENTVFSTTYSKYTLEQLTEKLKDKNYNVERITYI